MAETMYASNKNNDQNKTKYYSAFMASLPVGITHSPCMFHSLTGQKKNISLLALE